MDMKHALTLGLFLATNLIAADAFPCSPPDEPVELTIAQIGQPDALGFQVRGTASGPPTVVVEGASGEVSGSTVASEIVDSLLVFRPDEPLPPGTYTMSVSLGDAESRPTTRTAEVTVAPAGEAATLEVEATPGIREQTAGRICCSTEPNGCLDECTGSCFSCWDTGYIYSRTLDVALVMNGPRIVRTTLDPVQSGLEGYAERTVLAIDGTTGLELFGGELDTEETCVQIEVLDLLGTAVASDTRCVAANDFPAFEERAPDAPDEVAACAEPPEDESDPNWQRYGVDEPPTVDPDDDELRNDDGGGCSTSGSSNASIALLFLALLGMRRLR